MYRRSFKLIRRFVDHSVRRGLLLAGSAVLGALFEATSVALTVKAMFGMALEGNDTFVFLGRSFSAQFVIVVALGCALGTVVMHLLNARGASLLVADVGENVRVQSSDAFANASWAAQAQQREGSLQDLLTSVSSGVATLARVVAFFFGAVATLSIFVLAAVIIQPVATVVFVAIGVLTLAVLRPMTRRARQASEGYVRAERDFADVASRVSGSAMESKVFGVQHRVARLLREDARLLAEDSARFRFAIDANGYLYRDLAVIFLILVVASNYLIGAKSFASITVVMALLFRAMASAQLSNHLYQAIIEYAPFAEVASERIDSLRSATQKFGTEELASFKELSLSDVSYLYEGALTPAVSGVNLTLRKGEVVGLSGPSGAGKSTIAQIVLRLRLPSGGKVEVDGRDYVQIAEDQWAKAVAFVPQEPSLLAGTIRENIAYYRSLDDAAIVHAAQLANIHEVICALPGGYDAPLGPRGTGLSGGQKQRLAIARALAAAPTVLVLDEPTSALDSESEAAVIASIEALRHECAVLVVTHRASTEAVCDRIVRI